MLSTERLFNIALNIAAWLEYRLSTDQKYNYNWEEILEIYFGKLQFDDQLETVPGMVGLGGGLAGDWELDHFGFTGLEIF